jgi:hypothetical protein
MNKMSQIIKFTQSSLQGDYSILTVSEIQQKTEEREAKQTVQHKDQPREQHKDPDKLIPVMFKTCNRKFSKR